MGESRGPEEATRVLCEAVVPELADAAAVYVDGAVRHRVDPGGRLPPRWDGDGIAEAALLDGRLLAAPLRAYGEPVGCALLARDARRPPFGEAHVLAAGQLAVPAALAIHHGQKDRRQDETLETLQLGMRPGD